LYIKEKDFCVRTEIYCEKVRKVVYLNSKYQWKSRINHFSSPQEPYTGLCHKRCSFLLL